MKLISALTGAFLLSQLTACTTTVKVVKSNSPAQMKAIVSGVAAPIEFKTDHSYSGQDGCSLIFVPSQEAKNYEVPFKPGKDIVFADLPTGVYHYKEIDCGSHHWDLAFEKIPPFTVFEGKIAVTAGVHMWMDDHQKMSIKMNGRSETYAATQDVIKKVGVGRQADLVSAYTGDPLEITALEEKPHHVWEAKDAQGKPMKVQFPSFKECYKKEYSENPLWIGQMVANASYKDGQFKNVTMNKGGSVYSDHFMECVRSTLNDFHPPKKVALRYNLGL